MTGAEGIESKEARKKGKKERTKKNGELNLMRTTKEEFNRNTITKAERKEGLGMEETSKAGSEIKSTQGRRARLKQGIGGRVWGSRGKRIGEASHPGPEKEDEEDDACTVDRDAEREIQKQFGMAEETDARAHHKRWRALRRKRKNVLQKKGENAALIKRGEKDPRIPVQTKQRKPGMARAESKEAQVEPRSKGRVKPPVTKEEGVVSMQEADDLRDALERLPEGAWRSRKGAQREDAYFDAPDYSWMELGGKGRDMGSEEDHALREVEAAAAPCVKALTMAAGKGYENVKMTRAFINKYEPFKARGRPKQYLLKPHMDGHHGRLTATLALRTEGSRGGALVVSFLPDGTMQMRSGERSGTVDTRRGKVATFPQNHGDVLTMPGDKVEHFVESTLKETRFTLVVFVTGGTKQREGRGKKGKEKREEAKLDQGREN